MNSSGGSATDLFQRGLGDHQAGRLQQAEATYRQVLTVEPAHADALHLLGVIAHQVGRNDLAIDYIRRAIGFDGVNPNYYSHLGVALRDLGRTGRGRSELADSLASQCGFSRCSHQPRQCALRSRPSGRGGGELPTRPCASGRTYRAPITTSAMHCVTSAVRQRRRRATERLCAFGRTYPYAHQPRRCTMRSRPSGGGGGELPRGPALQTGLPKHSANLGYALLLAGRFEEGWKEYEWRWKAKSCSGGARDFSAPLWSGEPIGDRVILLHAEQGLGDTLQFCRYVPLIASGARTVLEVQAPLVRLLSRLPGITRDRRSRRQVAAL